MCFAGTDWRRLAGAIVLTAVLLLTLAGTVRANGSIGAVCDHTCELSTDVPWCTSGCHQHRPVAFAAGFGASIAGLLLLVRRRPGGDAAVPSDPASTLLYRPPRLTF